LRSKLFLDEIPEVGLSNGISITRNFVGYAKTSRDDSRQIEGVADADYLSANVIEGWQDDDVREILVGAVHTKIIPADHDVILCTYRR
jgi:hypothetical protein